MDGLRVDRLLVRRRAEPATADVSAARPPQKRGL
jgi:hypothetical protein